jgi:hypothetical protein
MSCSLLTLFSYSYSLVSCFPPDTTLLFVEFLIQQRKREKESKPEMWKAVDGGETITIWVRRRMSDAKTH